MNLEPCTYEHDVPLVNRITGEQEGTVRLWGGWTWTSTNGTEYKTNGEGEGLWFWHNGEANWKQIRGTCQFSLPQDRGKALRKLRRLGYS